MSEQPTTEFKLPPISKRQTNHDSPFRLGNDNQIFNEQQPSVSENSKKIWEKTTSNHRNPLKRFDKFVVPIDQKYVPATVYGAKEKKIIEEALQLINIRKKNKDFGSKKEIIVDILQQKKEMFLVTMTHGIIENEISNLKNQTQQRKKALEESEQLLENDKKQFQKHQETYKQKNKQAELEFQTQVKSRKVLQQQIKSQQIIVNSLRTQKTRNQQNINSYLKYKRFLDQLLPKEWVQEIQRYKKEKIQEIKNQYFYKWMQETQYSSESKSSTDKKNRHNKKFQQLVDREEIMQVLKLQNEEEMYFKQPHQIIQLLNGLEETNLFCIQNSRMASQAYQVLKTQFQQKKVYLESKYKGLLQHKSVLEKQLYQSQSQIRQMKKKKQQNNSNISEKDHRDLKNIIQIEYNNMKDIMPSFMPEFENADAAPLSLLSCIQICMQKLLDRLFEASSSDPKMIGSIRVMLQKKKNTQKREEAALNKQQQERRKSRNQNKKEATVRIVGRVDMMRSAPKDKHKVKKVEVNNNPFDNDRKYFLE